MVRVYFNIPKKTFSLQRKNDGQWKATGYVNFFKLENAQFIVSEKGRQRVLREKRKNVYAYILGEETNMGISGGLEFSNIRYNPCETISFVEESGDAVFGVDLVIGYVVENKPVVLGFWINKNTEKMSGN